MMSFPLLQVSEHHNLHPTSSNVLRLGSDEQWIEKISSALSDNRFCLYLREINALATLDTQRAYDILLFLITEDGQKVPASIFQPIAERYGFSRQLSYWTHVLWSAGWARTCHGAANCMSFAVSTQNLNFTWMKAIWRQSD